MYGFIVIELIEIIQTTNVLNTSAYKTLDVFNYSCTCRKSLKAVV